MLGCALILLEASVEHFEMFLLDSVNIIVSSQAVVGLYTRPNVFPSQSRYSRLESSRRYITPCVREVYAAIFEYTAAFLRYMSEKSKYRTWSLFLLNDAELS